MARVIVTEESSTGRNVRFYDNVKHRDMSRQEFVSRIENDEYPKYHVRVVNGLKTPVSDPDGTENNNLD